MERPQENDYQQRLFSAHIHGKMCYQMASIFVADVYWFIFGVSFVVMNSLCIACTIAIGTAKTPGTRIHLYNVMAFLCESEMH